MNSLVSLIKEKALELGFVALGIGSAEPFPLYRQELRSRPEMYGWASNLAARTSLGDLPLERFADPREFLTEARSIIVVVEDYAETAFPPSLLGRIGRCYQRGLFSPIDTTSKRRRKELRKFLQAQGMRVLYGPAPARLAGSRAGVIHYGKNGFAYANWAAGQSSWVVLEPYLVDRELPPDSSSFYLGCPEGCRICLEACPTGALYEPLRMDPRRCIAFHTYFNDGEIPRDLRPKMGSWVYGCDICQEACPRNQKWLDGERPADPELFRRAEDWALSQLLTMSQEYYESRVWPFLYYIRKENRRLWQRNAAVALGNEGSPDTIPLLRSALEDPAPLVRSHVAWALGRIGGAMARRVLEAHLRKEGEEKIREEIRWALEGL